MKREWAIASAAAKCAKLRHVTDPGRMSNKRRIELGLGAP
jgi:hypothetical protein